MGIVASQQDGLPFRALFRAQWYTDARGCGAVHPAPHSIASHPGGRPLINKPLALLGGPAPLLQSPPPRDPGRSRRLYDRS